MDGHDLTGRTAIVTGASRGIGLAIARELRAKGARVVLTARTLEAAAGAAATLGQDAAGFAAHVLDEEAAAACVEFAIDRFGSLDILVNNAGTNPAPGPLVEQEHGAVSKVFDVNVWAPILWTGLAWRVWMAEHGGVVINNASVSGIILTPDLGVYNASKAAVIHLTKQFASELGPRVRVNAVAPGVVRTRLAERLWKEHENAVSRTIPLGRIGEPEDVAKVVAFLATEAAAWVTGETFVVDGGQRLGTPTPSREVDTE